MATPYAQNDIAGTPMSDPTLNIPLPTSDPQESTQLPSSSCLEPVERLSIQESWVPKSLHRRTMIFFMASYVVLIIALAVLFDYSNKHNGLASSTDRLHYLWTFGPTALFTITASFWTKVELQTKQLAPWRALSKGPSSAKHTLLLDYISSWNIRSLISSAISRDFDVTLAITGTLLLQLIVIFSTGLFALEQQKITQDNTTMMTTSKFTESTRAVSARSFSNAMAIQAYGSRNPDGATDTFAYQTLDNSQTPPNAIMTTIVDALYPNPVCKVVNASCYVKPYIVQGYPTWTLDLNFTETECPFTEATIRSGIYDNTNYFVGETDSIRVSALNPNETGFCDRKWWSVWVCHTDLSDRTHTRTHSVRNETYHDYEASMSCIMCEPRLELRKARVTTDGKTYNASLIEGPPIHTALNISAWEIHRSVLETDKLARQTILDPAIGPSYFPNEIQLQQSFFRLMNASVPRRSFEEWMDTKFLLEATRKAYQGLAVHVILEQYSQTASQTVNGTITWIENRLLVRSLPFYLIISILVVLIIVATLLSLHRPEGLVPRDPGSIAGLASIIASSPDIQVLLKDTGNSFRATKMRLKDSDSFQSRVIGNAGNKRFQISSSKEAAAGSYYPSRQIWWQPFPFSIPGKILTLTLPVAGIIALEILFQMSNHKQGIVNVSNNQYIRYAWAFVPALLVWGFNLNFESVYFNNIVVQPYHLLRCQPVAADQALTSSLTSNILVHNAWIALKKRWLSVFFSSMAVVVGAILPIAVAGLYTAEITTIASSSHLVQKSWFNATHSFFTDPINLTEADIFIDSKLVRDPVPNMILYSNVSFPQWTYGPYALSEVDFTEETIIQSNLSGSVAYALIPGVRGRANCTIMQAQQIPYMKFVQDLEHYMFKPYFFKNIPIPERCVEYNMLDPEDIQYFGRFTTGYNDHELMLLNITATGPSLPLGFVEIWEPNPPFKANDSKICVREVTFAACWPYVEEVLLNTTFLLPSFRIVSAAPSPPNNNIRGGYPVFSEAEIVTKLDGSHGTYLEYSWGNFLTSSVPDSTSKNMLFDLFMQAVIWGKDGITAAKLVGRGNEQRLLDRVDEVYGLIMAQLYNSQARISLLPNSTRLSATFVERNQVRIKQSNIATRIMEIILGCMLVCCIATYLLLDTKELLPQNPCSIGAAASYVAGSKLVDRSIMPVGSEFLLEKDIERSEILSGKSFKFGWYKIDGRKRFGIFSS